MKSFVRRHAQHRRIITSPPPTPLPKSFVETTQKMSEYPTMEESVENDEPDLNHASISQPKPSFETCANHAANVAELPAAMPVGSVANQEKTWMQYLFSWWA